MVYNPPRPTRSGASTPGQKPRPKRAARPRPSQSYSTSTEAPRPKVDADRADVREISQLPIEAAERAAPTRSPRTTGQGRQAPRAVAPAAGRQLDERELARARAAALRKIEQNPLRRVELRCHGWVRDALAQKNDWIWCEECADHRRVVAVEE